MPPLRLRPRSPFDDPNCDTSRWSTVTSTFVRPEVEREPRWLEWTHMDRLWTKFFSSYFFLFKGTPGLDHVLPMDRLVESLRKALVLFFPLAGRLLTDETDSVPRLHCNDEGPLLVHRRYDGVVGDLIDEDQFRPNELISGLWDFDPGAERYPDGGLPTLIIQVTDFQCGTRCLSTSWSHMVADGYSGAHFLASWAQISRGENLSLVPVVDRSLLAPRKSSPILDRKAMPRFLNNKNTGAFAGFTTPEGGVRCQTLLFTKHKMDALKAEALAGLDGRPTRLSTLDCVGAFLWRTVTEHRGLEPHEATRFACLVNARARVQDMPAGYFGNCLILVTCVTTVDDLLSKPLARAAALIHDTVHAVDGELVKDWVDWLSLGEFNYGAVGDEPFMDGDPRVNLHTVTASWQNRFPFFELDFGRGPPAAALRNGFQMGYFNLGMFFGLPTSTSAGDIALTLFAENEVLDEMGDLL